MKCMLFKSRKTLINELMNIESEYLRLYCEVNDIVGEEEVEYCYKHSTSLELIGYMKRQYFIFRIKYYKKWIATYENVLEENKRESR